MELPSFSGLGTKLLRVLQALDIDHLEPPVWTLKENTGKIYLDICWNKFPATSTGAGVTTARTIPAEPPLNSNGQRTGLDTKYAKLPPSVDASAKVDTHTPPSRTKKKKKKSPATQKRDKQRLVSWLNKKKKSSETVSKLSELQSTHLGLKNPSVKSDHQDTKSPVIDLKYVHEPGIQAGNSNELVNTPVIPEEVKEVPTSGDNDSELDNPAEVPNPVDEVVETPELATDGVNAETGDPAEAKCANCLRPDSKILGGLYLDCDDCDTMYCSMECRHEHFPVHRPVCGKN